MAQICPTLQDIERLEATLGLQLARTPEEGPTGALSQAVGRIVVRTGDLSQHVTYDSTFDAAVQAYSFDVLSIYSRHSSLGPVTTARRFTTPTHQNLLRRMLTLGEAICERSPESTPPSEEISQSTPVAGFISAMRGLGAGGSAAKLALMLLALSVLIYCLLRYARNRALQKVRFGCNYPASVIDDGGRQRLRIIDISAVGAKLRLAGDRPLLDNISLDIGRRRVAARVAWQNSHYAGLVFRRALPARHVRQISNGEIDREAPDRRP